MFVNYSFVFMYWRREWWVIFRVRRIVDCLFWKFRREGGGKFLENDFVVLFFLEGFSVDFVYFWLFVGWFICCVFFWG